MDYKLIEKPTLSDYQEIIEVLNTVFVAFPKHRDYTAKFAFEKMQAGKDPLVIKVYDDSKKLIGFAMSFERYPGYYHLWQLGVLPEYRGFGVATRIYEMVEGHAKKNQYKGVSINTFNRYKANMRLLVKRGYEIYDLDRTGEYKDDPKILFRLVFGP